MVVADLGDDEAGRVVGDPATVDLELAHRAIVPLRFAGARADTERVRSETPDRVAPVASSLSILMPVYNELATVERAIDDALRAELPVESRQLVLVDDGSRDGTRDILTRLAEELKFKLIFQQQNGGKGAALRRGFQEVTGDLMIIQAADLEYSPEEFPQLIELICEGRADVVYGSRFLGRHRVFLFTHYAGNRFLTLVTNILYNTMLSDMETCYKVMRTEVLRSMTLESDGFGIEPELTAKIFKRHYRVYEVPITYDGRGYEEGKKITWRDGFVALWVLLKYRFSE